MKKTLFVKLQNRKIRKSIVSGKFESYNDDFMMAAHQYCSQNYTVYHSELSDTCKNCITYAFDFI